MSADKEQWIVTLDTGRFGDWVVVTLPSGSVEKDVLRLLTRAQRRKVQSVRKTYRKAA